MYGTAEQHRAARRFIMPLPDVHLTPRCVYTYEDKSKRVGNTRLLYCVITIGAWAGCGFR